jgi:glycosyltransferase 2 family protein
MHRKQLKSQSLLTRLALSGLVLAGGVYVLARNWHIVRQSLRIATDANLAWVGLAGALMALTFMVAAAIYCVLAQHRLRYRATVLVEIAAAFVNRLLPAGIGGLGLHGIYLYHQKHTSAEATVVVSMNNLIGMMAHLALLAGVLLWHPSLLHTFTAGRHLIDWRIGAGVLGSVLVMLAAFPHVRKQVKTFLVHMLGSIRQVQVSRAGGALLLAMLLTMTYTMLLYASAHALSAQVNILQTFIVFSVGMLASTATPTPGGLVGAEAGLFAGLFAYGVSAPVAGAVVLLYRLISYWLPLVPGLIALVIVRQKKLV